MSKIELIASSLELPNGAVIPNRLVKVAMEEGIGHGGGLPGRRHCELYRRWGEGGWGMLISGNVQVDPRHLATPHDRTIPSTSQHTISAYSALRFATLSSLPPDTKAPLLIMQISHAGLQSSSTIGASRLPWVPAIGPSSMRPNTGNSWAGKVVGRTLWPTKSRQIVDFAEWEGIVQKFVDAAVVAEKAGWEGVQVHSAHGYLLAEYLSPLTNPNPLPLPGVHWKIPVRLHLLFLILRGVHAATRREFIKAIKINCSDFVQGGLDEAQSAEIIKEIVSWRMVDVLEVSGGNYSNPGIVAFTDSQRPTSSRQALFSHFTSALLPSLPSPPEGPAIILTGSIHSRELIHSSLETRTCDLVGIGRPSCIYPALPRDVILNIDVPDEEAVFGGYHIRGGDWVKQALGGEKSSGKKASKGIPLVGAGVSTFWHEWQMCRLGRGVEPDINMSWLGAALWEGVVFAVIGAVLGVFRRK
ncbi:uncharacterized protein MKK02DRAFT_24991 [Dioszegia hungarica]|uniref:NADH:flavin oxidoreductase/NADH oxidase N-terminal domain-containing protein n=1 Tax=Dioszegia hungarica TaxID=4972 RepID=A0AA38H8V2_9TREE|nr:uncharacterized protein MKK02DRAFT_24991 [Dioszegia hungarica]KAI9635074.1 hypothetical protein MKK02DRAFT_24991 [Dioszegia hungarica]